MVKRAVCLSARKLSSESSVTVVLHELRSAASHLKIITCVETTLKSVQLRGLPVGVFEDFNQFLEERLDEFLRQHPYLELQALEEQLREQEEQANALKIDLKAQEQRLQEDILKTAQDVKLWHIRIEKAKAAGRYDLVEPAQVREATLLRQGNQLWGQMNGIKERMRQTEDLANRIRQRRREVATELKAAQQSQAASSTNYWNNAAWQAPPRTSSPQPDPLEETFQRWETDDELEALKRQMGR